MPRIKVPKGLAGVTRLPRTNRGLTNCFNNGQDRIIGRPGIQSLQDRAEGIVARGSFVWNNALYQVSGTDLIKITNVMTGAHTVIGTIAGSQPIRSAPGFNHIAIVVQGSSTYSLDKSDTLTDTTGNTNFVPYVDVTHINNRFVYVPANGDPAQFTDIGAVGDIQVDSFFDAEEIPDLNNSTFSFKNTLYIGGTDSFELFRDRGTATSINPFRRVSGARIDKGFIGGLLEYNEAFLFIGRERRQDRGIYRISVGGAAVKISNERIDVILSEAGEEELRNAVASRFTWHGYDIATFSLSTITFGFYGGEWFLLNSLVDAELIQWAAGYITQFEGAHYTAWRNRIGKLAQLNTDYGERITRIINVGFEQEDSKHFTCQSLELGISQGFNEAIGSVALEVSHDNVTFRPKLFRNLGSKGQYNQKLIWNYGGGLGNFEGFMGANFYSAEDIDFSVDYIRANFR